MKEFVIKYINSPIVDSATSQITQQVMHLALILSVLFFIITLAYNFAKTTLNSAGKGGNKFFDINELIRTLLILLIISLYTPISKTLIGGIEYFNSYTLPIEEQSETMQKKFTAYTEATADNEKKTEIRKLKKAIKECTDPIQKNFYTDKLNILLDKKAPVTKIKGPEQGIWSTLKRILNILLNPMELTSAVLIALIGLILQIVKVVILLLSVVLMRVLVIIGPLSFAFSILPPFKDKIDKWFQTLLIIGFSFTTLNILDSLFYAVIDQYWKSAIYLDANNVSDPLMSAALNFALVICYFSVYWLTSMFVGKSETGRFVSKGLTLGTMAAAYVGKAAIGLATGGKGMGAGGKSNVAKDIFKVAKGAMKDDKD